MKQPLQLSNHRLSVWFPLVLLAVGGCSKGSEPSAPVPIPPATTPSAEPPEVIGAKGVTVPDSVSARPVHTPRAGLDLGILAVALGEATYYADKFEGRRTASGIVFSNRKMYAAHLKYPFGTVVRVTNLRNNKSVVLEVVDRGPHGNERTIIDVSRRAAEELQMVRAGRVPVRVEVLDWGESRRGSR